MLSIPFQELQAFPLSVDFVGPSYAEPQTTIFGLFNKNKQQRIAFKIQANCRRNIDVSQVFGFVEPSGNIAITITCKPMDEETRASRKDKHLTIVSCDARDYMGANTPLNSETFWKKRAAAPQANDSKLNSISIPVNFYVDGAAHGRAAQKGPVSMVTTFMGGHNKNTRMMSIYKVAEPGAKPVELLCTAVPAYDPNAAKAQPAEECPQPTDDVVNTVYNAATSNAHSNTPNQPNPQLNPKSTKTNEQTQQQTQMSQGNLLKPQMGADGSALSGVSAVSGKTGLSQTPKCPSIHPTPAAPKSVQPPTSVSQSAPNTKKAPVAQSPNASRPLSASTWKGTNTSTMANTDTFNSTTTTNNQSSALSAPSQPFKATDISSPTNDRPSTSASKPTPTATVYDKATKTPMCSSNQTTGNGQSPSTAGATTNQRAAQGSAPMTTPGQPPFVPAVVMGASQAKLPAPRSTYAPAAVGGGTKSGYLAPNM